jgi:hypothetical protein
VIVVSTVSAVSAVSTVISTLKILYPTNYSQIMEPPADKHVKPPAPTKIGEHIIFPDHPEFTPNLTPRHIFKLGSFGGTYWRPIFSGVNSRNYEKIHNEFAALHTTDGTDTVTWWHDIPISYLTSPECEPTRNKYGVASGTSLADWESHGWIHAQDPYGWVQWYCRFYAGRRSPDDKRQIARWNAFAGPKGRFRTRLISMCKHKRKSYDDNTVSPVIRQGLQHWAYILTKEDFAHG